MKIAIYGYGNIGRGVQCAIAQSPDAELFGVFTRREPSALKTAAPCAVYPAADIEKYAGEIDVVIICAGSATDLPEMSPAFAGKFNIVDSFDTHARIPEHFENVDKAARAGGKVALISGGWDPGMFSIARLYASAILPDGADYTFWGRGVSQGHSDAIRHIPGVVDARQYTVPVPEALEAVRSGAQPELSTRQKHTRECYVVAAEGADRDAIREAIVTMPNYFADYDTTVEFISAEEMAEKHSALPHGGTVIRSGSTGLCGEHKHIIEYNLTLDSNPEFTASILVACARAVLKKQQKGESGCVTVFDLAPAELSPLSPEELRAKIL